MVKSETDSSSKPSANTQDACSPSVRTRLRFHVLTVVKRMRSNSPAPSAAAKEMAPYNSSMGSYTSATGSVQSPHSENSKMRMGGCSFF